MKTESVFQGTNNGTSGMVVVATGVVISGAMLGEIIYGLGAALS